MDYREQEPQIRKKEKAPLKQCAADWLAGVAGEEDEVKDMILQDLWKKVLNIGCEILSPVFPID